MQKEKIAEFLTVMITGIILVSLVMLALYYLAGTAQYIIIGLIIIAAVALLSYLRKRFGREDS
ncbi:MAG: hypothetical protein ACYC27_13280 [Armatimonadota bacterium]